MEQDELAKQFAEHTQRDEPSNDYSDSKDNPTLNEVLSAGPELKKHVEEATTFLEHTSKGYTKDPLFSVILKNEEQYSSFKYRDGYLYTTNWGGHEVLCILRVVTKDYSVTATSHRTSPYYSWALWCTKDSGLHPLLVLVAQIRSQSGEVLHNMQYLPSNEDTDSMAHWTVAYLAYPQSPFGINQNGLYQSIPQVERI